MLDTPKSWGHSCSFWDHAKSTLPFGGRGSLFTLLPRLKSADKEQMTVHSAGEQGWTGADYKSKGQKICAALKAFCIDSETLLPKLGDWATDRSTKQETGTGMNQKCNLITRTSDWMLGHFRKFSQVGLFCEYYCMYG